MTPLSLYESIMPQVYLWETAQELQTGEVRAERRCVTLSLIYANDSSSDSRKYVVERFYFSADGDEGECARRW